MSAWHDAPALRAFLRRARRRLAWLAAAEGAAAGLVVAILVVLVGTARDSIAVNLGIAGAIVLVAATLRLLFFLREPARVAQCVERNARECRNVIVTAAELIDRPTTVRPYIGAMVCAQATRLAERLDPATLFPARRITAVLSASALLWTVFVLRIEARPVDPGTRDVPFESVTIDDLEVTITPPAYTGQRAQTLREPARIEALAGSRIALSIGATAATVDVATLETRSTLAASTPGTFGGELLVEADGYIAIEPRATDGRAGMGRLIGLSVYADRDPRVRITTPGRDLFVPDAGRTLDVVIEADDDYGLASLFLRMTKVSGSGEQFTFTDAELPLTLTRRDAQRWSGRAALRLDTLGLEAGDVLVYRGVAADRRPDAPAIESDAFFVEVTAPGAVAAEGFAIDDEMDRYALSQQMVILQTERLIGRAPALGTDSLNAEASRIAAEQRSVRAEFVFMMGGELAEEVEQAAAGIGDLNEEAHVELDDEAIAGRLRNQGRLALMQAIRAMSRAYSALNDRQLDSALVEEKAALEHLQRAFSRTRYILRALTEREQLDLTRRLSGTLPAAGSDTWPAARAGAPARVAALRGILAGVAALARDPSFDAASGQRATDLAEDALRADPSAEPLQQVARWLTEAATAMATGQIELARARLDEAAMGLDAEVRRDLLAAPAAASPLELNRLDGARTDALRRSGGRP